MQINVGSDKGTIRDSEIQIGDVAGRDNAHMLPVKQEEVDQLRQRVRELEQSVFGDERLGLVGIRQQLQGLRFWILFNTGLSLILIVYEIIRTSSA